MQRFAANLIIASGMRVLVTSAASFSKDDQTAINYNSGAINLATSMVPVSAYNNHQWRKNFFNQTDVTVDVNTGAVRHKILAGMELGQQKTDYLRMTGVFANRGTSINVPLANPGGPLPVTYVLGGSAADRDGSSKANIAGFYAQDQLDLSPQWQVIAGLRYDSFKLDYHNNRSGGVGAVPASAADLSSKDNLWSPRAGIVFKPVPNASIYANYSVASFPRGGDQLSSLSSVNQSEWQRRRS